MGSVAVVWLSLPIASGIAAETQFIGWCLSPAFTHCREVSGEVVMVKSLSYILLLMVPEQV